MDSTIIKADCQHCGHLIYLSDGSVLWRDYAVAEGMNGGYCPADTSHHDHVPVTGSMR